MGVAEAEGSERILIEEFSRRLGFDRLAEWLPGDDIYHPYLYLGTFVFLDIIVVNTLKHFLTDGTHSLIRNPFIGAIPIGVGVTLVWIRWYTHHAHGPEIQGLEKYTEGNTSLDYGLSLRTKFTVYVFVTVGMVIQLDFLIGYQEIIRVQGSVWGLIWNHLTGVLCYIPIAVEGVLLYFSVHVLLPRRLANVDLQVYFFDPRDLGGFRPVGELIKRSYYLYTAGLVMYLIFMYGPYLVPYEFNRPGSGPGLFIAAFFTTLWAIGLGTVSYSIYKVHKIMARQKNKQLNEIEDELHQWIDNPYDISSAEIEDEEKFKEVQQRLREVRATSEYPATFTMWTQIVISVILPQLFQLSLQSTL